MNLAVQSAIEGLETLKMYTIGIYKHSNIGIFELVLSIDKQRETIETVFISQFGAIQRGFSVPYQQGILKLFPDNRNMNQMLDNPFEWNEFIKSFK